MTHQNDENDEKLKMILAQYKPEVPEAPRDELEALRRRIERGQKPAAIRWSWALKYVMPLAACLVLVLGVLIVDQRSKNDSAELGAYVYETMVAEPFDDEELLAEYAAGDFLD